MYSKTCSKAMQQPELHVRCVFKCQFPTTSTFSEALLLPNAEHTYTQTDTHAHNHTGGLTLGVKNMFFLLLPLSSTNSPPTCAVGEESSPTMDHCLFFFIPSPFQCQTLKLSPPLLFVAH